MEVDAEESDDRLRADALIYERLRADEFDGSHWERYANDLARYGCSVLQAWLQSGVIVAKCREAGRSIGVLPYDWTADDRLEIALETVATGLVTFRRSLAADRWTPTKGASLRTYFLGSCVLALPNVMRSWRRQANRWEQWLASEQRHPMIESKISLEPIEVIEAKMALEKLLGSESDRVRAILSLDYYDYSTPEIAEILNMTSGAVSSARARAHRKLRESGWDQ